MSNAFEANLRLVGGGDDFARAQWRREQDAREAVVRENRLAAWSASDDVRLDPTDPRWVLAARARSQMQGPILTPERREKLLRLGTTLGLRKFEANLIIALVQDEARQGMRPGMLAEKVQTVESHAGSAARATGWPRWLAAITCAIVGTAFLIWWVMG